MAFLIVVLVTDAFSVIPNTQVRICLIFMFRWI